MLTAVLAAVCFAVDVEFECKVRGYAYEYAQHLQGWRGEHNMKQVFDALELTTLCNATFDHSLLRAEHRRTFPATTALIVYVAVDGSDDPSPTRGDITNPFATLHAAVASLRTTRQHAPLPLDQNPATIVLRSGAHYLSDTLRLTEEDSFLTISAYPGEDADLKGSLPLKTEWSKVTTMKGNVYSANLAGQVNELRALRVGGKRGNPASYPDRDVELTIFPDGWVPMTANATWSAPKTPKTKPVYVYVENPHLTDKTLYTNYAVGINDTCEIFTPPVSYWCAAKPTGGMASRFTLPSGITTPKGLLKTYDNPSEALFTVWRPGHWANWMFEVDGYNSTTQTFNFSKGGFQGARGKNVGAEWFISHVIEELDSATEYFFDKKSSTLYYYHNSTDGTPPPSDLLFEAVNTQTLISHHGTQTRPIKNITIAGITIRDSAPTFMEPHGVPSGGDWALQRMGALFYEGAENCVIDSCLVTRIDGNAVMLSGYNRGMQILKNEFVWIGDSVMASWGYSMPVGGNDSALAQYKSGIDGTGGEQPHGTQVIQNFIHELGHFEKQSSPWFQAKTSGTLLKQNIAFNMPRAGINFNDGFGGGNEVTENLLWNTCRESGDHANFNSWDRQPFLVTTPNGTSSLDPEYSEIHHNFLIGNDGAVNTVDNDDGSSFYRIHHNFLVYGGHKSNWGGHSKLSYNNINAMAKVYQDGRCVQDIAESLKGTEDGYFNNTCIQDAAGLIVYQLKYCDPTNLKNSSMLELHDNKLYSPDGDTIILCNKTNITMAAFQAAGFDPRTTVQKSPSYDSIIQWAKELLSSNL